MRQIKLFASVTSREIRKIPASDSEKPIVVYLSSDSLRMIKGSFARRGIPFESFMTGNVLFFEGPEKSMSRDQATNLSNLPEVPASSSPCPFIHRRDRETGPCTGAPPRPPEREGPRDKQDGACPVLEEVAVVDPIELGVLLEYLRDKLFEDKSGGARPGSSTQLSFF